MRSVASTLVFLFLALGALAQPKLSAKLDRKQVRAGERFTVTFGFNNASGSTFQPPEFGELAVLSGPNRSTSMSFVNGRMSSSMEISYVLVAEKEGEYTIGAAAIKADGETYRSKAIKFKAAKGAAKPQTRTGQNRSGSSNSTDLANNVFLRLTTSRNSTYLGEQLVATYKLYYNLNIVDYSPGTLPAFNGFWSQNVEIPAEEQSGTEVINGKRYNYAVIQKVVLFPQRTGDLIIDPFYYDMVVRVPDNRSRRSVFDHFFGNYKDVKYRVESNKATIKVKALPKAGQPASFNGSVGKYSLEGAVDKNAIKANEAINLTVKIKGRGNLKLLEAPEIDFPPDFEVYDPKETDRISVTGNGVSGSRTFEYLVIPRHAGDYHIDPIAFSYFDPAQKQYVELTTDGFDLSVARGEEEAGSAPVSRSQKQVTILGEDIRFIKAGAADLEEKGDFFFDTVPYYGLMGSTLLGFLAFVVVRNRYQSYASDTVGLRIRKARKIAAQRLSTARQHLDAGRTTEFYEAVFHALYGFLSDKLNIPVSDLSKERVSEVLHQRAIDGAVINQLMATLDRCEMARFAPSSDVTGQEVFDQAATIISQLQQALK